MSGFQHLGGTTRTGRVIGPSLDKIIKNVAWRKHASLVSTCKAALDRLEAVPSDGVDDLSSPLSGLPLPDAEFVLQPLILALDTASIKVIEPTLDCVFKLFSIGLLRGEIHNPNPNPNDSSSGDPLPLLLDAVCKVCSTADESIELGVLRVFLSAVRSPCVLLRGDCLVHIVRTCYNVYLGGMTPSNQICAKAVLAQIMLIVFTRVEEGSFNAPYRNVSVDKLLDIADKNLCEGNSLNFCQGFINEVMNASEGVPDDNCLLWTSSPRETQNNDDEFESPTKNISDKGDSPTSSGGGDSKLREDGFLLFKNLCKLSMKYSSQENPDDQILVRGKVLSLELLRVIIDNAGPAWRSNERYLNAIKQYLCLSLLKNSALTVMAVFQLLCCIFVNLVTKYRSGLKAEIGIFFPMLILRVLENVLQPSYIQKMTVLNLLDKISQESQLPIDIFVNYDCDVDAPNIFERTVNGLLKTALGPPPGSTTTLSMAQDITFRHESVKCLVTIIKSMGTWMDHQLRIGDSYLPKRSVSDSSVENSPIGEEGIVSDCELHSEFNSELSDAATLEQRRTYKIELQKGISLFNRKPAKGIEFLINTKKIGGSPEEVAAFLKNTSGLSETMIGDYLGEREEFSLKVMHAYVDSFNFEGIDFGEAIRFFLRSFRLPGEAQKIDRIMEKFAERYCKCNPSSFATADTAYVLAYSVIMLNTDAHNNMVKDKMTKADFIKNNRGIDNGKDLPEKYLGALYDQIVKNEIKIIAESSAQQSKQVNSFNKLLGFDGILNLVSWRQTEEKPLGANGVLIRHIQEQFKAKSGKSESVYHAITDPSILRFMVEVSWGPMLAAFSVTLDQSDDEIATAQCLMGFRHAVHVTAMMGMQTQRDAFVSSIAKFTFLHCAADMKQKNVDAMKEVISIAIEDGNYLQDAWEHILTCLSRIEHLQLLGEGSPSDASFLSVPNVDLEEKTPKNVGVSSLKRKGSLQNPAVMAVVRGGSYDSTSLGLNTSGQLTPIQISNFISNLNLLEQIGNFELNQVFAHSQRLNSDAIVAFVRALCKVSILELQSPTDPRVFSLTKIVEIAHYNMTRIRLVWSRIWHVLSDFFVSVGLSENLSVAIFVMDSLRQLAMKFLEREELANYNFQNEFLRPFVIVVQKSNSTEIRELIVRCISQMVLSRVSNVKSGWKSVFMVFTTAAADERKNIVLLAFETMEKIVREYFPYITETETMTFTDCVKCLLTFTNSRFNSDVSLNAIAFLRFCAVKLAEGGLARNEKNGVDGSFFPLVNEETSDIQAFTDKDDHVSFWVPLLTGLSKLTFEPRPAIRKTSLEVLFDILKDHGHLFSRPFWVGIFNSVIFPIFNLPEKGDVHMKDERTWPESPHYDANTWDPETTGVATECLVDLFVRYFEAVRSQLPGLVSIMTGFIRSSIQGPTSTGVNALVHLAGGLGHKLSEDEWKYLFLALREAAESTLPEFMKVVRSMDEIDVPDNYHLNTDTENMSDHELTAACLEDDNLQTVAYIVSRTKAHISMQLLIIQVVSDLCKANVEYMSHDNIKILLEIFSSVASHATQLNSETVWQRKLHKACSILELTGPPIVHFENDSYQNFLNFLQDLLMEYPALSEKIDIESRTVALCEKILKIYLNCTTDPTNQQKKAVQNWILQLPVARKEELTARTPLVVSALQVLTSLESDSFKRYISRLFPLLVDLVRCEHTSGEVQIVLSSMFQSCIGPVLVK